MVIAFSSGLRQRLYKSNVSVVTVKPGFVDTPMTSELKKGFLWAKPSAVATLILKAIDRKKPEVYVPAFWQYVMVIIKFIPNWIFQKVNL